MQNKSNLLHEIKRSVNGNGDTDKIVAKIKNKEIKEELKGKGKLDDSYCRIGEI